MEVLLLTQGTWGDIFPFVQIGKELNARGHQLTLTANQMFSERIRQTGFDPGQVVNLPTFEEWNEKKGLPDTRASRLMHLKDQVGWFFEIVERYRQRPNTVLVSHFGLHLAIQMIVDRLNVPYLPVYSAPFFMLNVAAQEDLYQANSDALNQLRAAYGVPPVRDWRAWLRAQPRGLGLWPEWFAAPEIGWPQGVRLSGFVSNEPPAPDGLPDGVRAFLADGPPPIFINHGSSRPRERDYFRKVIEACRLFGRRAIVVTKYDDLVTDVLGADTFHCPVLHFPSLLGQVSVMVSHGGMGTIGQALSQGVPQLLFPENSDQHDNASRLHHLGVAEVLPPFRRRPEIIADALYRLSTSPSVTRQCQHLADLSRQADPVAAACDVIEDFIGHHIPDFRPARGNEREAVRL